MPVIGSLVNPDHLTAYKLWIAPATCPDARPIEHSAVVFVRERAGGGRIYPETSASNRDP